MTGKGRVRAPRFAYELEVEPIPKGVCVLHSCDVRACCNPLHLHLGTRTQNSREAVERNRMARGNKVRSRWGETHPRAKLTEAQVRRIRSLHTRGWTYKALGEQFKVTHQAIHYVVTRKNWKHVV